MAVHTPLEVLQAWVAAGGPAIPEAVAYAWIESGYNDSAVSPTGCCGVWQLCSCVGSGNIAANASAAVAKYKACNGGSFACDWTPYDLGPANPQWGAGYAAGVQAVASLGGSPGAGTSTAAPSTSGSAAAAPAGSAGSTGADFGASALTAAGNSILGELVGFALVGVGIVLVLWAGYLVAGNTSAGQAVKSTVGKGVKLAAMVPK